MWKGLKRQTKNKFKIVRTLLKTKLEASVKKEAEKIRSDGRKDRRIRNRKAENILKILRRLLEAKLKANMKKETEKIRKYDKKTEELEIAEKTIVEARLDEES